MNDTAEIFTVTLYCESALSVDKPIRLGDHVPIRIEVKNVSSKPVWITGVLDGSERGLRFPHYMPLIEGPVANKNAPEYPDAGTSPLRKKDFRLLSPEESFDPTNETIYTGIRSLHSETLFHQSRENIVSAWYFQRIATTMNNGLAP
ncbi:MAG: hypothetical protein JWP81_4430 [Ferruginibacter sp.]|nr:hypothetical protein [Ferruginibacter sp.]